MLSLRPTTEAGLAAVTAWEADPDTACWLGETGPTWHRRALRDPTQEHLTAVHGTAPVGFAVLARIPGPDIELRRLVLAPEHRGGGRGRELLLAVLAHVAALPGATGIWLDVKADNDRARRLYESAGFTVTRTLGELIFLRRPVTTTTDHTRAR